jgi:hypothetical protein
MVFTVDYRNNLKGNDLTVPLDKYKNCDHLPDIDYNHINSSTVTNERKYDISNYNPGQNVLIIKKFYPNCDKTKSKSVDLSLRNSGVLSKLKNIQEKPPDNYICMEEEIGIQDTYYLTAAPILKSSRNLLKPATFTGKISDVPNRENPVHKNIGIQLIKII